MPETAASRRSNGDEQLLDRGLVETRPRVRDADAHALAAVGALDRHANLAAAPVVLDRVRDQVDQHLLQALVVREHVAVAARQLRVVDHDLHALGERPREVDRVVDERLHGDRLCGDRQRPLLDARDVEHLVDDPEQVVRRLQDHRHLLLVLLLEIGELEQLAEAHDRAER